MLSRTIRIAAVAAMAAAAAGAGVGTATIASAASAAPAVPHMVPANTVITAKLKLGTNFTAVGTIDGIGITVTCTSVKATGKTPADGLKAPLTAPPTFSGCTDSLGGTDTVTTAGKWAVALNSTGTAGKLLVPQNGSTFSSSLLGSSCTIDVAPTAKAKISGTYNNKNTLTITNAPLPVAPSSTSTCTSGPTTSVSSTLVVKPAVSVAG